VPKNVLYLAENALSPIQGGGIVAYALLRGAPAANLFGLYTYESITPAPEYAQCMHLLPRRDGRRERTFRPNFGPGALVEGPVALNLRRVRALALHFFDRLLDRDTRDAVAKIDAAGFRPEAIFTAPLSYRMLRLARRLAGRYSVPVVMLNMDDWMSEQEGVWGPLGGYIRRAIAGEMRAIAPRVQQALSNSGRLAEELTRRYALRHETANNACYDLLRGAPWAPRPRSNGPVVITFAGALNWHLQGETLVLFSYAVAELAAQRPLELHIYTPWEFAPIANQISIPGKVVYKGYCPKEELVKRYLDSDFLLATTTFDDRNILLFKHSLATKLSDYLSVGRPVISVGHPQWALHDYVEAHGAGVAVRGPRIQDMKRALSGALEWSDEKRSEVGEANRALWSGAHDVTVMGAKARAALGLGPVPAEL
jgi:glycosyltransferase involved in cell wall biosynthesis